MRGCPHIARVRVSSGLGSDTSAAKACSGSRRAASVVLVGAPGLGRKLSTREIVFPPPLRRRAEAATAAQRRVAARPLTNRHVPDQLKLRSTASFQAAAPKEADERVH